MKLAEPSPDSSDRSRRLRDFLPMSLADVFDEAFDLYKQNGSLFAGITAVVQIPTLVAWDSLTIALGFDRLETLDSRNSEEIGAVVLGFLAALILMAGINILIYAVQSAALTLAASDRYMGLPAQIMGSYRAILPMIPRILVTWIVAVLVVGLVSTFIGVSMLVLMALIASAFQALGGPIGEAGAVVFSVLAGALPVLAFIGVLAFLAMFISPIIVVERNGYFPAISRNIDLVRTGFPRLFGASLVLMLIVPSLWLAIYFSVEFILDLTVYRWLLPPLVVRSVVRAVVSGVSWLFVQPYISVALTLLYYDQRIRCEGFDLAVLERHLQESAGPAAPAAAP